MGPGHALHVSHVAPIADDEEGKEEVSSNWPRPTARQSTDFHLSRPLSAAQKSITDSASLQTAIEAWCLNSTQAAEMYGDISTWCVKYLVQVLRTTFYSCSSPLSLFAPPSNNSVPSKVSTTPWSNLRNLNLLMGILPLSFLPSFVALLFIHRDTSSVDDMSHLISTYCSTSRTFNGCISAWDVSSVTDMSWMFENAYAFNQALVAWDISGVVDIRYIFSGAQAFNHALAIWDVSRLRDMNDMFHMAYAFNQPLATWDVSSVTTMEWMFYDAHVFNQPLDTWDVSSVTNMEWMFYDAYVFNQILCWNMSRVTNTLSMFNQSGTTYDYAIDNPVCPLTANPTLQPTSGPTPPPSSMPQAPSSLPSSAPSAPSQLPSYFPTHHPTLLPSKLPSPSPSFLPTPAPSITPWFLTWVYFELTAAAGGLGVIVAALFAGFFRLRLGRWPPLLRTTAAAVGIASLGIEVLYSAAAASSSGQFCTDCPSEAGWTIFMLSSVTCGIILVYRVYHFRFALDTSVALGSVSIYALVILLASLEGDLLVWLPWIETPATLTLAGFPDDSFISFTTWCILLHKLPFFAFTASNVARSDVISASEYLTLAIMGISLAMSLSTKYMRQVAFPNTGLLDTYVGVHNDASRAANLTSSESQCSSSNGAVRLGDVGDTGEPLLEGGSVGGDEEGGKRAVSDISGNASNCSGLAASQVSSTGEVQIDAPDTSNHVGATALSVSSTGWLQTAASAAMGIGLVILVVTDEIPSFVVVLKISKYVLAVVGAILVLGIVGLGVGYACNLIVASCCNRKAVRTSFLEKLEGYLESERGIAEEERERAETGRRHQNNTTNFMHNDLGVKSAHLPPLEETKARLRVIKPRVETGTTSEEEKAEMTRLLSLLDANPEAKQQEEEARVAFRAEQASINATAARRLRTFFPPNARLLPSITALEAAGVGTSVASRLLRNNALLLVLTPPEEIASMNWVDFSKCSSLGLSLFELRAVVASIPGKFATDTAKDEKRKWAKGLVEALRSMVEKEAKGELQPKDLCHPCFHNTKNNFGCSSRNPDVGPFDSSLPLTVRSGPNSGAADSQTATASEKTGKTISERSAAAIAGLERRNEQPIDRTVAEGKAGTRRLRVARRASGTA